MTKIIDFGKETINEDFYRQVALHVIKEQAVSIHGIQVQFGIGFNKACNLIDRLMFDRVCSEVNNDGKRIVLMASQENFKNLWNR